MLKKLGAAIMSLMLAVPCVYGARQEYTGGYNGVKTSPFVTSVSGKNVTVSTKVLSNSETPEEAVMLVTIYKNKKLVNAYKSVSKQLTSSSQDFSLTVPLPDEVSSLSDLANYEVNASIISPDGGFVPLSGPAYLPVKEESKMLRDISVGGNRIDDFASDKTKYSYYVHKYNSIEDYNNNNPTNTLPEISALTGDSGTQVDINTVGEYPGTVEINALHTDSSVSAYTIDFKYYVHGVKGGAVEADFSDDADTYQGQISLETKVNLGGQKGVLCTNLHGNPDSSDASASGSRWFTDGTPLKGQRHEIYYVDDEYVGADYYAFYNGSDEYKKEGFEFVQFEASENIEVCILDYTERTYEGFDAPVKTAEDQIRGRYLNGTQGDKIMAPTYDLADKIVDGITYNSAADFNYKYKTSKAFAKGEKVSVKTTNSVSGGYRSPIIVIKPL